MIHGVVVDAAHGHAAFDMVMPALAAPPAAVALALVATSIAVQPFPWFTVKVCPPMAMVPVRAGPVLAATL